MTVITKTQELDYICTDGMKLHYMQTPPGKPPLVLIHGQSMCRLDYEKNLPALSEHFTVYVPDCPGHGLSGRAAEGYSCRTAGDAVREFISKVTGKCFLAGHSSGAIIAAYIAAQEKELIKAVLLEDPPFFRFLPGEQENTFVWKDCFSVNHGFLNQSEEKDYLPYYIKHSYVYGMFGKDFVERLYREAKEQTAVSTSGPVRLRRLPKNAMHGLDFIDSFDMRFAEAFYNGTWFEGLSQEQLLKDINCPVIYLKAATRYGKDGVLWAANSDEDAAKAVDLIKNCRCETVVSGHDIHWEKPDIFSEAVISMLR